MCYIQRAIIFKTQSHVRLFQPLHKEVSDPLMAVDLGRRSGFPFQVKNGFLMDENMFSVSYSAVTCHHGTWMFPFRCFAFSFSYLMLKNRQKGLVLCVVWFLLFCFFLICAVNYCAVHCVSSPVY